MPNTQHERIAALWALADARREASEPMRRTPSLAYTPPPGDSADPSPRYWLTEDEADELHALTIAQVVCDREAAEARVRAKIATRRQCV